MRLFLLLIACSLLASTIAFCGEDVVESKLMAAKDDYETAMSKARAGLLADLKKKAEAAQKSGDLKVLEAVQAEAKAFEEAGELPKSVPSRSYESQIRVARARMEDSYSVAVKQYTKDGSISLAKVIQAELDDFKRNGVVSVPADLVKVNSVWVGDNPRKVLTITERNGEQFRGRFVIGGNIERDVTGVVKGDRLSWLAKDVRAIKGEVGGDNFGTISMDGSTGDRIDFVYGLGKASGTFSLRLETTIKK